MIPEFVFDPTKVNFGNLYRPGTFGGDSYWNSIFSGLGIDTSKPMPSVTEFVPAPPPPAPTLVAAAEPTPYGGGKNPFPVNFFSQPNAALPFLPTPTPEQIEEGKKTIEKYIKITNDLNKSWEQFGINPDIKGTNRLNELVTILRNNSISDLSKLKIQTTPYEQEIYYAGNEENLPSTEIHRGVHGKLLYGDQSFGRLPGIGKDEVIPREFLGSPRKNVYTLASSSAGKRGGVDYNAYTDDEGNIKAIVPEWVASDSGWSAFLPVLGLAAAPFTGGLSAALGGGLAGTIGANALIQGGLGGLSAAASGGDFLEGALKGGATGAFTAGIGSLVNPIASSIGADVLKATDSKFLSDIVSGAVKGVPGALMSGDASNLLTGAVTGAVGSQVGDQLGLTPKQSQVAMGIASKLLQGGDLSPSDIFRIGTSFGGKTPTASETAVGGGAETSGFFDPDVEAGLLYYGSDPDQEKYIDEDRLLARYPAPTVEDVRTSMSPMELNKFLEANIEDPGTIATLMQEYFPDLYRQQIEVVGNRPPAELFPEFEQPLLTAEPTTPAPTPTAAPAPTPAPAPGPSPAPSPAPSSSTAQSGMDMSGLFALLGMMNQGQEKPDPYQVAQINARSPFGTIYDQQQDLLRLIGRG
jgi:hypothetical protein